MGVGTFFGSPYDGSDSTASDVAFPLPYGGKYTNFSCLFPILPATGSVIVTAFKNGSTTPMTLTWNSGSPNSQSIATPVTWAQGDSFYIQFVSTDAAAAYSGCTMR